MKNVRAYEITVIGLPGRIIEAAETTGKAKSSQCLAAREAGMALSFIDFRARRAPEFDELAKGPGLLGWENNLAMYGCLVKENK